MALERQTQWLAFLKRGRLGAPLDAGVLAEALRAFLWPPLAASAHRETFQQTWPAGGPWSAIA